MFASAKQLEPNVSAEEAAALANLDWPVLTQPTAMAHPDQPTYLGSAKTLPLDDYRAVVKGVEPFTVFQVASDKYRPHQNLGKYDPDHGVGVIDTAFSTAREVGLEPARIGHLRDGGLIFIQCKMADKPSELKDERIDRYFTLVTSHDGSVRTKAGLTTVCIVCINTFMAAQNQLDWSLSHRSNLTVASVDAMKIALAEMHELFGKFMHEADRLSGARFADTGTMLRLVDWITNPSRTTKPLTDPDALKRAPVVTANMSYHAQRAWDILYNTRTEEGDRISSPEQLNRTGKAVLEEILGGPGSQLEARKGNAWGIFNGVTRYADHVAPVRAEGEAGKQLVREYSGTFGTNGKMKRDALADLLGYAELVEKELLLD